MFGAMDDNGLQTIRMLARRYRGYGISLSWLKAEAEAGRIPCLRVGRRLLFNPATVDRILLVRAGRSDSGNAATATDATNNQNTAD